MNNLTKECTKCNKIKNLSEYHKQNGRKYNLQSYCKQCISFTNRNKRRTKDGLLASIYSNQVTHSKSRGLSKPEYTKNELQEWAYSQQLFHTLHHKWVMCNYKNNLTPSIDRKDDYEGYTISNIQLMTWDENRSKGHIDMLNGKNCKQNKTVLQFTKENIFIYEWYSLNSAMRETGIAAGSISRCCSGELHTAGGFIWKLKEPS